MINTKLIFEEISTLFPHARCELNYTTPHELLFAIMLSAQTTDESVNKVTSKLFQKYKTLTDYAASTVEELAQDLRSLGLYKNKAKNMFLTANMILTEYGGNIPRDQEKLESFPGVGRKTANVFLSEYYKVPRIAVDTHVSRVSIRLGMADESDTPRQIEEKLMKLFDSSVWIELHHKLIFFGRYFCKAKKPNCKECPLVSICKTPFL